MGNARAHCWRVRYPTERAALLAVIVQMAERRQPTVSRPYQCSRCRQWHLEGTKEESTKAKEAERALVVAITDGCAEVKGSGDIVFREGEVFAADHPLVRQCPMFFVPSGATTAEVWAAKVAAGSYRV